MKLLVAEDEPGSRLLLQRTLESWGYQVAVAADGDAALVALQDPEVRLAVLDWMMPGPDGLEVCRRILELGRFVYAILLTSRGETGDIAHALETGASDYIVKPFDPGQLRARLRVGERLVRMETELVQLQKLESIGRLASGIAHEINTPLQYICDNLQFLRDGFEQLHPLLKRVGALAGPGDPSAAASPDLAALASAAEDLDLPYLMEEIPLSLGQSLEGARSVSTIVSAMKQFAEPGGQDRRPVDLAQAVQGTITVAAHAWRGVAEVEVDLDPELPPVPCFPGELHQVLLDLLTNAADGIRRAAAECGREHGTIRVVAHRSGDRAEIRVEDTGIGIAEEVQDRIFDPFFTSKPVGSGTGLGLASVHSAVTRLGGTIRVESRPGEGTAFTLRLPLAAEPSG